MEQPTVSTLDEYFENIPIKRDQDLEKKALEMAYAGGLMQDIAKAFGMSRMHFWRYQERYPFFAEKLRKAREIGTHEFVDNIMMQSLDHTKNAHIMRNAVTMTQFIARSRNRADYGEKLDMNINKTININGILDDVDARVAKLTEVNPSYLIENTKENQIVERGLEPQDAPLDAKKAFLDLL